MASFYREVKVANPAGRNPSLLTIGFGGNPYKKGGKKMAKKRSGKRKRKSGGFSGYHKHSKGRNPFGGGKKKRRGGRRRNPSMRGLFAGFRPVQLLKTGFFALLGLVGTRQIPQMFLQERNAGLWGYLANAITAGVVSAGVGAFLGSEAGGAALLGGGLYLVNRIITDNFSPVGRYLALSGIGDPLALSGIEPGYFPLPVPLDAQGRPIVPSEIRAGGVVALPGAGAAAAAPANGAAMAGVGTGMGRFGGRW